LAKQTQRNALPPSLKERLAAFRNLPAFFALVWETSPSMALGNALLRLLQSFLPLVKLTLGKLIIDRIVLLAARHSGYIDTTLWKLVAAEFLIVLLSDALGRAVALLDGLLGDLFANHTSVRIMKHAALLDLEQFEDSDFYDKLERARQQTTGRTILLSQVMSQLQDLVTMTFLAYGLLAFNPWLILVLIVTIIPAFLGENYFNDQNYVLTRSQTPKRRELDYLRYLGASDETAKEVKIFDLSNFIIGRFKVLSNQFFTDSRFIAIRRASWGTLFALVGNLGYYGTYVFIVSRTITGAISLGSLTFLAGSFIQLKSLLGGILTRFTAVSQGAVYLRDFFDFFDVKPIIARPGGAAEMRLFPRPVKIGFSFENVGFKYAHSERWANRHLTFTLHQGEKLALVGENGAGKTTLVKLLARLYEPTEGRILLDGIDLREYDPDDLRLNIGIIFQDFLKYQMTFGQNIAVGNIAEQANADLIAKSAKQSMADELTAKLPASYQQMLGKRFNDGVELSGGEWQKIAIARAYMRDAQLLILDEPTAALDARAEFEVFKRFTELTEGKSAVLISHRFSTVRMATRILVLVNGEMAEIGSHEELLEKGGRYAELFNLQAAGYR